MSYDSLFFVSKPTYERHPDRFATVAALFGLKTKSVDECRVLELGCSTGDNLFPLALNFPKSSFLGVDYSEKQISHANNTKAELALTNIEFRCLDITDLKENIGKFHYIICHGMYSWVSSDIQDKILQICKQHLEADGLAYISFNCAPGWDIRSNLRDALLGDISSDQNPSLQAKKAREALQSRLRKLRNLPGDKTYIEISNILSQSDGYISRIVEPKRKL